MKRSNFYVIIDRKSGLSVTTMPSYSLCQGVISNLPKRRGYLINKIPNKTKFLDEEFSEEITQTQIVSYYEGIKRPLQPADWYTNAPRTDLPSGPDGLSEN